MSEESIDSESIKSEDTAVLYSKIMASSSALIIYKILMPILEAPDIL